MTKIAEIKNEQEKRVCDIYEDVDEIILSIKCNDNKNNYSFREIKFTNMLQQVYFHANDTEKKKIINTIL